MDQQDLYGCVELLKLRFKKSYPDKKPMSDLGASKGFIKDLIKEFQ